MARFFGIGTAVCILVVICVWIPMPGFALKCHVCNSVDNEACEDIKDDKYLTDCLEIDMERGKNHTNCRKEVFSAYSAPFDMHTQRTVRSCGYETHPRLKCFYSSNIDLKGTTCECSDQDGCNGSDMQRFAIESLLLVILCGFLASLLAT